MRNVYLFLALACVITWATNVPALLAIWAGATPSSGAMMLTGLGALGPTLAALVLALREPKVREVFGRWRTKPLWIVAGLLTIPFLQLLARLIEVALGGHPAQWFYPPNRPEYIAALIFFSFGEEFGWRGYAHPRLAALHGPVVGSVILGSVWAIWHFGMWSIAGAPPLGWPAGILEMIAGSLIFAWVFERGDRSMAVAIALHMGAHLDSGYRVPADEVRFHVLRLAVIVIAGGLAAISFARGKKP
jgi:uncharacterized protein